MSLRPVYLVHCTSGQPKFLLRAYSQPQYQGDSAEYTSEVTTLVAWTPMSFRVIRGRWLLFDEDSCGGNQFVLQEGNYPDLTSCGCMATSIKSLKPIPFCFSDPSISLFSLDSFEGLETIAVTAIEHLDNFFTQSLRVSSGLWVAYEYPNFKGRQMLLGPGSVSAWARHSGWDTVGSLHPLRQPKVYVRVWNRCLGSVLTAESGQGCSPPVKVSLSPPGSLDTQLWVFSGALLKCKATAMCLSVIGGRASPGARVALWPQHGRTNQKWSLNENGTISSHLDHNLVLDLKGKPHDFCIRVSLAFFV
uniref:Beta/gamma crystallin 'Greek key' domain-containing protein n=1 Tax=Scleropages formosus TaxID=113540 RepID=A0A8C9V447_SCLFO